MHRSVQPEELVLEIVSSSAGLQAIRSDWDQLYEAATGGVNPFLRWIWLWHWWRSVRHRRGWPRTALQLLVMRDGHGQMRAAVPWFLGTWGVGPLAFRSLRLYGFHTTLTDLRTPIVWPDWEPAAALGLIRALAALRDRYHFCVLDGLAEASPFTQQLVEQAPMSQWRRGRELPAYILPLPPTWGELRSRLTRNNRGSLQQGYNALERDRRTYSFDVVSDPGVLPAALDTLFRLHRARAARHSGPPHSDYYAHPEDRAFLCAVAADLARAGLLRVCQLRVDGTVTASRVILSAGPDLYFYHAGHDPAWGRYRVGTLLTAECIKMAIGAGIRAIHLGTGTEESKIRWSPRVESYAQLQIASPTPTGRLLGGAADRALLLSRRLRDRWPHGSWRRPVVSDLRSVGARLARARL